MLRIVVFTLACAAALQAQQTIAKSDPPAPVQTTAAADAVAGSDAAPISEAKPGAAADRTTLNLLGEVDVDSGEGRRNENVKLTLIDNNVLKELNTRMGTTATITKEFKIDEGYFGTQFGGSSQPSVHVPTSGATGSHGNVFWTHNNSVFSARSFFQVGKVQPARTNDYGFNADLSPWKGARFSIQGSQGKLRGQVNGNVLVPGADERVPTTTDPADRAVVQAILNAYPTDLPNRTDINSRALNTNAPQNIDNHRIGGTLEQTLGAEDRLLFRYNYTLQEVEAFQLVGGQNPDTTTRNHAARISWVRTWSARTISEFTAGFDRTGSLLVPEETSIGSYYLFSRELESIGPSGDIPIDRAQNVYRTGGRIRQLRGNHNLTFGFELAARQINGWESSDHRGLFSFRSDFGRDLITNLLEGTPSVYMLTIGNAHRGFRNWDTQFYAGDEWHATRNLTLNIGLRYQPVARPSEVNNLTVIPYHSDWTNLAPRFGFAYRLPGNLGTIRANYGLHYGEIFPATFMQARFNQPQNLTIAVRAPKLSDPLRGFSSADLEPGARSELKQLAPDLRTPYVHLYNFLWELELPGDWALEMGYVGSRAHALLTMWYLNRGEAVEGIEQISATVDARRPDQNYYDVKHIHNGSRAYFDAAKVTLRIPRAAGFNGEVSYWFAKAIDLGADYTNTASGSDGRMSRGPSMYEFQAEMRGLSSYDQPHALLASLDYETPTLSGAGRVVRQALASWQFSSVALFKSGTPFEVQSGSDGPGWGNVDGASSDNPVLLDPSVLYRSVDHPDTSAGRLPASAFTTIEPTDPRGNLGRNTFRKDGIANLNLAVSKRWYVAGDKNVLFRVESLNLLNHPQFEEPGRGLSSKNFGQITNTLNDGRTYRFTLQFGW